MSGGKKEYLFLLFALTILVSSPFVVASFSDWWAQFTGKATSGNAATSVVVGNTQPTVHIVSIVTPNLTAPVEGNWNHLVIVTFNASDPDGISNLQDSSASVNLSFDYSTFINSSCAWLADFSNDSMYNCTINVPWYVIPSGKGYIVNASIRDISGSYVENNSQRYFAGTLSAMTMNSTQLNWTTSISTSTTNVSSTNHPLYLNNTGNNNFSTVALNATNLRGLTTTTQFIYANNFSTAVSNSSVCGGTTLVNNSATTVGSSALNRGLYSGASADLGGEELFFCLKGIPIDSTAQTYDSSAYHAWIASVA